MKNNRKDQAVFLPKYSIVKPTGSYHVPASKRLFSASLLNMNGQLRITRHLIKATSMKGRNQSEETGKGNSKESEAMQGAKEKFKENIVKSSGR